MGVVQNSVEASVRMRTVPEPGGWLSHRLPDWPRIWGACVRRTRSWPVPPRWTPRDWREELDAEGIAAACTAIRNFDPTRGPTLGSFVYHQILSSALARYRQEWSYALRCRPGLDGQEGLCLSGEEQLAADDDSERLRNTMGRLVEDDRRLIQRLFWDGWTESQVAGSMGISQQAVSKRKQKILHELRRRFVRNGEV
jgi:RNA polymerase sigma factor (sigma-70 family)